MTQAWGWRWLFGLSAPIGLVVALLALAFVPAPDRHPDGAPFDRAGAVTITLGLALTVFGLSRGPVAGWEVGDVLSLVLGAGLLWSFVRAEARARDPLVPARLVRSGPFAVASGVAFVANAAFAVSMYYVALYLQEVDDLSPTETGLVFLAMTIPLMTLAPLLGAFIRRMGRTGVMRTGMAVLVVSFVAFAAISGDHGLGWSIVGLALAGAGQALAFNGSNEAALAAAGTVDSGVASGVVNGGRQVGSLIGLAAAGALFNPIHHAHLDDGASDAFLAALRPTMLAMAGACLVTTLVVGWYGRVRPAAR